MSCFHPLKAIQYKNLPGKNPGKHPIRILRSGESFPENATDEIETLMIPCGQCSGCRMDYARQWANRLMLELESYKDDLDSCHFITLTIDDNNIDSIGDEPGSKIRRRLPKLHVARPFADSDTGVVIGWSHSLSKYDLQLFIKRLRRARPDDRIRYFACGEYGSKSLRPHYHMIVFGLHLDKDDLKFYKKNKIGQNYYSSKLLEKEWPYGYNVVAGVSYESCCYVARYMLKKQKGIGAQLYDKFNLEEPFTLSSRRPGIAHEYYENNPLDSSNSNIIIGTKSGSRSFPAPRYLEKLFEFDDPAIAESRKRLRRISALSRQNLVAKQTTLSTEEYLAMQEKRFLKSMKILDNTKQL